MIRSCPTCGFRPPVTATECPKCGAELTPPTPYRTDSNILSWVWGVLALLLAVGFGLWLWLR